MKTHAVKEATPRIVFQQVIDFMFILLAAVGIVETLAQTAWGNDFNIVLDRPVIFGAAFFTGFLSWVLDRRAP